MTLEKFFSIVDSIKPNECGCMIWPHGKDRDGYPKARINEINGTARCTRVVLSRKLGRELSKTMKALHTCDVPSCLNPDHLWEGTTQENTLDKYSKGRDKGLARGDRHYKAKITNEQAKEIILLTRNSNLTNAKLALVYDVTPGNIWHIRHGKTFKLLNT